MQKSIESEHKDKLKVELLKINADRKKKGLPLIPESEYLAQHQQEADTSTSESITLTAEAKPQQQQQEQQQEEVSEDEVSRKYKGFDQIALQNIFGTYQGERLEFIARESEKQAWEVYFFKRSEMQPPEFGVEPAKEDNKNRLIKKVVYFHMLPTEIYNQIRDIRNELNDMSRIEGLTRGQFDEGGKLVPAKLPVNDFSVTQMTDEEFARLHRIVGEKTMEQYKIAAKWLFGMPEQYVDGSNNSELIVEDNSFRVAVDAALYKVEWTVRNSKTLKNLYG